MRNRLALLIVVPGLMSILHAQGTPSSPRFEVASIKLNNACLDTPLAVGSTQSPARLTMHCVPLTSAIQSAYVIYKDGLPPVSLGSNVPIEGAPAWLATDLYDIDAVTGGIERQELMRGPILRALLEDRLKLRIRMETREVPVYALTTIGGSHKLHAFVDGSCTPLNVNAAGPRPADQAPPCTSSFHPIAPDFSTVLFESHGMTLDAFARQFGIALDRRVLNRTNLTGAFDFRLEFAVDQTTPRFVRPATPPSPKPSVFQAIQDQLGLKLEATKGPGEFLVIEHVERPTEN